MQTDRGVKMRIINKDITTVTEGVILHGVNCQHRMGSGVAKAIYTKWPKVREYYMALKTHPLGFPQTVCIESGKLYVINGHTQEFYGYDGKVYADIQAIVNCVQSTIALASNLELPIYIPMIGSGLGGLDWDNEVRPAIESVEKELNYEVNACII